MICLFCGKLLRNERIILSVDERIIALKMCWGNVALLTFLVVMSGVHYCYYYHHHHHHHHHHHYLFIYLFIFAVLRSWEPPMFPSLLSVLRSRIVKTQFYCKASKYLLSRDKIGIIFRERVLLISILYCDSGPGCLIRTVCKYTYGASYHGYHI